MNISPLQERELNSNDQSGLLMKKAQSEATKAPFEENMTSSTGFTGSENSASEDIVMEEDQTQPNAIYNENKELAQFSQKLNKLED